LAKYRDLGLRVRFITSDEHRAGQIAEIAGEEDAKFHYGVFDEVWFFSTFYISLDHRRASSRIGRKSAPDLL